MSTKFKPDFKPKFNSPFHVRYPDIMIKHDDKAADMFFSYVISGDVNSLDSFIIQNSIPINIRNNDGQSALHLSVTSDLSISSKLNMIKFLLMNYIPVNEKDNNGNTSLLLASKRAEEDVIELLMEYGADPNIGNTFKIKPLHYVSSGNLHNCEDVVQNSIIEKPTSQTYDKMEINELTKSVKDFYNDTLVNFTNLRPIELQPNNQPYPEKRILAFLKHNKYIAENIKNEDINKKIVDLKESTLKKYIDKIKDIQTNPNEIKNKLIEVRKEYVDEYVDIIKKVDKRIFEPIDLHPVDHIDDDGLVIANSQHQQQKIGGSILWKIHGAPTLNQTLQKSYMQIFSEIPQHLDEIKKNTDIYIDIIRGNETSIDGLKNQIIHSGKQIQKLELLDNIMRLIKMGSDLKYYDFQKIDTNPRGVANNILLNEALKNLFQTVSGPVANRNPNFGLQVLDQITGGNMVGYHVKSGNGPLNLRIFSVGANPNEYANDLLDEIKYNDDRIFLKPNEKKKEPIPIEINFSTPVTIQLNNGPGGFNDFFQKGAKAKWSFVPSNSVNNVIKIKLEYNSLTQVKLTATYNTEVDRNNPYKVNKPGIIQQSISTDFHSNLKIVYIGISANFIDDPWSSVNTINHNQNFLQNIDPNTADNIRPAAIQAAIAAADGQAAAAAVAVSVNTAVAAAAAAAAAATAAAAAAIIAATETAANAGSNSAAVAAAVTAVVDNTKATLVPADPNCITLSLPDTGGLRVYATQHLYLPLYGFHQSILTGNTNYKTIIENRINSINDAVTNCIDNINGVTLDGYNNVFTGLRDLIIEIYQYQVRYRNILELYGDEQIKVRLQKLEDIKKVLYNYQNIDRELYNEMIEGIDLLNWDYGKMVTNINGNLENIIDNINNLIENVNNISLINTINHYWNIQNNSFDVRRLIRHNPNPPDFFYKIENISLEDEFNYDSNIALDTYLNNKHYDVTIQNDNALQDNLWLSNKITDITGIHFSPQGGNDHKFVEPTYDIVGSSIIPNYFTLVRYRMLEEILLYIYHKKTNDDAEKTIYDEIDNYVKENIGDMLPQYRIPMVLSILGDTIDNLLINNLKKELHDIANNDFLEFMSGNLNGITLGTASTIAFDTFNPSVIQGKLRTHNTSGITINGPGNNVTIEKDDIPITVKAHVGTISGTILPDNITVDTNYSIDGINFDQNDQNSFDADKYIKITGNGYTLIFQNKVLFSYTELDLKTISFDDAFELNLGEIDSNVIDAIKKKVTDLDYDEIQILNKGDKLIMEPEYKNIDYNALDSKDQQIYYSTGFLDNSSKNLCIKYNNDIMKKIIKSGVGLDDTDLYGNTPLFYAIKTNNYLAVKTLLNKNARSLYKNDQNMTPLHYALHKLEQICDYFPGKNLITSINKSYNIGIKEELLKINSSRNLMKNYDKIVELYLFMYNSNAFSNIYAKNYNILKKFIEMISDQLDGPVLFQTGQSRLDNNKLDLILTDENKSNPELIVNTSYILKYGVSGDILTKLKVILKIIDPGHNLKFKNINGSEFPEKVIQNQVWIMSGTYQERESDKYKLLANPLFDYAKNIKNTPKIQKGIMSVLLNNKTLIENENEKLKKKKNYYKKK